MAYPQIAADELKHCISQPRFVGALVDSHLLNNTSYDSPEYDTLWDTFELFDVPIYLHPTYPPLRLSMKPDVCIRLAKMPFLTLRHQS